MEKLQTNLEPITKADVVKAFDCDNRLILLRKPSKCCIIHFQKGRPKKLFDWHDFAHEVICLAPSRLWKDKFYCGTSNGKVLTWEPSTQTSECIFSSSSAISAIQCRESSTDQENQSSESIAIGSTDLRVLNRKSVSVMREDISSSFHISLLWLKSQTSILLTLKDDGWLHAFDCESCKEADRINVEMTHISKMTDEEKVSLSSAMIAEKEIISVPCTNSIKILSFDKSFHEEKHLTPRSGKRPYFTKFFDCMHLLVGYYAEDCIDIFSFSKDIEINLVKSIETKIIHRHMDLNENGIFLGKGGEIFYSPIKAFNLQLDSPKKRKLSASSIYIDDEAEESEEDDEFGTGADNQAEVLQGLQSRRTSRLKDSDDETEPSKARSDNDTESSLGTFIDGDTEKAARVLSFTKNTRVLHPFVSIGYTAPYSGSQYLAYNISGYVAKQGEQIKVYFHDNRSPIFLGERSGVCLAALGENGVLIGTTTHISYKAFRSYGMNSDWNVHFNPSEEVQLLSAGTRILVAITSRYIRFYTHAGVEHAILCKPHRAICVTMFISSVSKLNRDHCAIMYEIEESVYELNIFDTSSSSLLKKVTVPIDRLSWMGWSSDDFFYVVDEKGAVLMLTSNWGLSWVPMYDPCDRSVNTEKYWIWGITEDSFLGHRLIGEEEFPTFGQVGTEYVRLQVPISNSGNIQQMVQTECIMRHTAKLDDLKSRSSCYGPSIAEKDIQSDQSRLRLFQFYVQEDFSAKAVEIGSSFELQSTIDDALRYCHEKDRTDLVKKLSRIREFRHRRKRVCELPDPCDEVSLREKEFLMRKLVLQNRRPLESASSAPPSRVSESNLQSSALIHSHSMQASENFSVDETGEQERASSTHMSPAFSSKRSPYFGSGK